MLERMLLFRPGLWLVLAISVVAVAWPARGVPMGAFAIGVASDSRYAYWCVLATLAGGDAAATARSTGAVPAQGRQA